MKYYTPKSRKRQEFFGRVWLALRLAGWALALRLEGVGSAGREVGWATGLAVGMVLEVPGPLRRGRGGGSSWGQRVGGWGRCIGGRMGG